MGSFYFEDDQDEIKRKKDAAQNDFFARQSLFPQMNENSFADPFNMLGRIGGNIYAKYEISQPNDPAEQQADALASSVMQGDPQQSQDIISQPTTEISRQAEGDAQETTSEFDTNLQSTKGQGETLDEDTQAELEAHTGTDLSQVKIHTDSAADALSRSIGAKAFAQGDDIYFKEGEYAPETAGGKELLAHEVAHVVQGAGKLSLKIQKQDDDDEKKYSYNIKIPPGTTSKEGFRRYAEVVIFGQVVNLSWGGSEGADAIYADIEHHIGAVIQFQVSESTLEKYKVSIPNQESQKDSDKTYGELGGKEKKELVDEINRRYYEKTGIKPGTQIESDDTNSAAIWNQTKYEVLHEKEMLDKLSPDVKAFLQIEGEIKPEDYEKYAAVAELFNQFNTADFLDYTSKIDFESTSLDELEESLKNYLQEKENRKEAANNREDIKTKLYGTEDLFEQYKDYLLDMTDTDSYSYLTEKKESLNKQAQVYGFIDLDDYLKYVTAYEKAFEDETLRIAEDHLQRYRHQLYEEEKRLNDSNYITALFNSLRNSGAQLHFEEADDNDMAADLIIGDDAGYAKGDRDLKEKSRRVATSERSAGEDAIRSLDSKLVKEEQFDRNAFSKMESEDEMKNYLLNYLHGKQNSIDETWEDIHKNPDHIYELDKLLPASKQAQQIEDGSIYDLIIQKKVKEINNSKVLKAICNIIIGIALVVATIATAGAAAPIAISVGIASLGFSLYGVYEAAEEYQRNNAANDVGLLTNDPSLVWVVLAIAGAAIDVAALSSAFKVSKSLAAMTKEFNTGLNVEKLEKNLATLSELDVRLQQNIVKQAKIQEQEAKILQGLNATRNMAFVTIPGLAETGELVARAIFAIRKGLLSLDSFIAELKAAKIIGEMGLSPEELLLVKDAFTKSRTLAADEKLVGEIEQALVEKDWVKLKELTNGLNFDAMGFPEALNHVKYRDMTVPRSKGIGGCHDQTEFAKIRQVDESNFLLPIGKNQNEVPEIIISSSLNHPSVPGVKIVKYKIPALDKELKTTGALKDIPNPKTIYDPTIWTDIKLEAGLKEALQDALNKNANILPETWTGFTKEGYEITGYYRNGKITTFYFK